MLRSTLGLLIAGSQLFASVSASAQEIEAPSAKCLEALSDARLWREHKLSCGFDRSKMRYAGTPAQQARCLLRFVPPGGHPVDRIARLPPALEKLVGKRVAVNRRQVEAFLRSKNIAADDVGGSLDTPLSRTSAGLPALYFVIHDTSTPAYGPEPFGPEIDQPGSIVNALERWRQGEASVAHIFYSRVGTSVTARDYAIPWRATKTERCVIGPDSRGRFLHNEVVQPRRTSGLQGYENDQPPDVAFTQAQLDRLALAYIAASVRDGRWLIPAFHAVIDEGLPAGHDDPQGFDLAQWTRSIELTLAAIAAFPRR
jgi:hypothetical protein